MRFKRIHLLAMGLTSAALCPVAEAKDGHYPSVRISVEQKYDDNVTFSNVNPRSDLITSLGAGVLLGHQGKKTRAELSGRVIQGLFWRRSEDSNLSEFLDLSVEHELSKLDRILMSDSFSHSEDPRSFEEESERTGGRFGFYRNRFDIAYQKSMAKDLSVKVGYGNDVDLASREGLIDSYVNRFSLQADYAFSSKNAVFAVYDFLHRRLEPGGTATVNTLSAGTRHFFTEQLSLEARAGADFIDSYNGDSLVEPLWRVTLADRLDERTTASVTLQQRNSTNPFTSDVFDFWSISGVIRRQLLRRLEGSASLFYSEGEYDASAVDEQFIGATLALIYALSKDWEGALEYTFSQRTASQEFREYDKNVVGVSVKREF